MEYVYKKIGAIVFGIFSPKNIKKMAAVKIVTPELYDKEGYPVDGGLMDIRLGVIDPGLRCKTCGGKLKECIGHFGYIELARPVIHIKYVSLILTFLRSICRECGRVLCDDVKIQEYLQSLDVIEKEKGSEAKRKKIKEFVSGLKGVNKCPHCKAKQGNIKLEKPCTFLEGDKRLSPIEIRSRFEKLSDGDILALGLDPNYAKPEWMILTIMPVPPVTTRPSITLETGERSEDDLTHKLGDIVRINQRLFENINAGAPEIIIEDLWDLLQYHVTTFFDNTIAQLTRARHRSKQPLKTISERIKSKEGRFRLNLAGKRVNYAARAVISPDPKIGLNYVGIPFIVAKELTVPEMVTEWNIERLKEFIKRGPSNYPGSNYVIRPDGKKKKITSETMDQLIEELQLGYLVERHLMDGDVVIFNRQPSLHRMSVMAHKVKILPGKTFRLNPSVCFPYNADFDGDEMNLHVPQNEEARAEADLLMQVQYHIITPKNGLNVVGCIQDAITGNYLLTKEGIFTKEEAINLLVSVGIDDISYFKKLKEKVSGKELFSTILPNDFDFIGSSKTPDKENKSSDVIIKKGQLVEGVIDQATIGGEKGSLVRALYVKYGEEKCLDVLGKASLIGVAYLLKRGFSTSVADTDLPAKTYLKCDEVIEEAFKEVNLIIKKLEEGKLRAEPGLNEEETAELQITGILNRIRNSIGDAVLGVSSEDNSVLIMVNSGAQGDIIKLSMMAASVGQQALRGRRIEKGYRKRPLSIFEEGDRSPAAKGFIRNSFKKGTNPYEYFYGAMTGRDSLMDTALRTPKSGYLYRRLSNALQDLRVEYDYTVRDANHTIIQFRYGEDDVDVSKSDGGTINVKKIVKEITKH